MASITQPPVTARPALSPRRGRIPLELPVGSGRRAARVVAAGHWVRRVTGRGGSLGAAGHWVRRVTGCGGSLGAAGHWARRVTGRGGSRRKVLERADVEEVIS
jgi:hypothetical protein